MSEKMSEKTTGKTTGKTTEEIHEGIQEKSVETPENVSAEGIDPGAVYESAADGPQAGDESAGDTADDVVGDVVGDVADEVAGEVDLVANLRTQLAESEAKANDYLDRLQRTAAEFQNSRRRQERQLAEEIERASGALVRRLLPILDDFDLAFQNVPLKLEVDAESADERGQAAWVDGFRQIRKKLGDILTDEGVVPIEAAGPFDPMLHEAIGSLPSEDVPSGYIVDVLRAGYTHKGKVVRPALVRVAL